MFILLLTLLPKCCSFGVFKALISILVQLEGKKRWRNQDKIKLLLGRLQSMHWIFQCMVGHVHRIYLRSIRCTTCIPRSSSHIGINPSNHSNPLLKQCEIMIVYEGNVFGKKKSLSLPSCSLLLLLLSSFCLMLYLLLDKYVSSWDVLT